MAALSLPIMLAGCVGVTGTNGIADITLNPGDSSICFDSPCATYLVMPPGDGTFLVKEDGPAGVWETGRFKAGEKVWLGSYWTGLTEFTIEGADVPSSWLTVMGGAR